jgi:hypothetical protein
VAVNPLLHQPTEPHIRLLETVQAGRELAGFPNYERTSTGSGTVIPRRVGRPSQWPIFQYVETVMYRKHGLDARAVLAECPTVLIGLGPSRYGWLRSEKPNPPSLQPDDRVALTVAGMTHLPALGAEVEVFLEALAYLVAHEHSFVPCATTVQEVAVTSSELARGLPEWILEAAELDSVRELLAHEPATWHCRVSSADGPGIWRLVLSPFLHPYTAIATAADYVDRVVQSTSLGMPELAPAYPSSLALAEAIDYFNAVWRLHAGGPLFKLSRAEGVARLALACATSDELDSRLSALGAILGHLELPGRATAAQLVHLRAYLTEHLSQEAAQRASAAISDLQAFLDLRAWRQHPGADDRGRRGMQQLGLQLPTFDYESAWRHLQARAVAALSALREEVDGIESRAPGGA